MVLKWFGRKSKTEPDANVEPTGPMGLVAGGSWQVDLLKLRTVADALQFEPYDGQSHIETHGIAALGEGMTVHRFYDNDDHMLQLLVHDSDPDTPAEITLFQPFHSAQPNSPEAWAEWTGPAGWMRAADYELDDGTMYQRTWFSEDSGAVELVQLSETVYTDRAQTTSDRIDQACMLFSRSIDGSDVQEHLLVIKETTKTGSSIEIMVGVDVAESALTVF